MFIASAGPLLMAGASTLLPSNADGSLTTATLNWSEQFKLGFEKKWSSGDVFTYKFASSELLMTLTVSAIPVLGLLGVAIYFFVRTGTFARSWVCLLLVATPALLILNSAAIVLLNSYPDFFLNVDWNVIETYRVSALRVLPFLPFLVGPLLIILDIAGDVAFYVLPESHPLSSRATTQGRLKALLAQVGTEVKNYTVYAHSQGSVIAADTLSVIRDRRATLVTVGSPITTLYESFLDIQPGQRSAEPHHRWINLFRVGDYVGGSISRADIDQEIGPGGHTNYWEDPAFKQGLQKTQNTFGN